MGRPCFVHSFFPLVVVVWTWQTVFCCPCYCYKDEDNSCLLFQISPHQDNLLLLPSPSHPLSFSSTSHPPPKKNISFKMRFSTVVLFTALAGMAAAAPLQSRSAVTEIGDAVKQVDNALGVTDLEDSLDKDFNGHITETEDALGLTKAEQVLHIERRLAQDGVLQDLGKDVKEIEDATGITAIDDGLDKATDGAITNVEDQLG